MKRDIRAWRGPRPAMVLAGTLAVALAGCVPQQPPPPRVVSAPPVAQPPPAPVAPPAAQTAPSITGTASWYHSGSQLQRTASGQKLNDGALTAASSTLPLGTKVRVERPNGQAVVVKVNDRMPPNHRVIDVSSTAANKLGLKGQGLAKVTVTPLASASAP